MSFAMADFSWDSGRAAGVLMHISCLPSEFGVGNIGSASDPFFEFLAECGFRYWQICPLNPTGYGDSPYQTFSLFAGNPYFIDLSELERLGLADKTELDGLRLLPKNFCDYGTLYAKYPKILKKAYEKVKESGFDVFAAGAGYGVAFERFKFESGQWLDNYALYAALKRANGSRPWYEWPEKFKNFKSALSEKLPGEILEHAEFVKFVQWVFFGQFAKFRARAKKFGVEIFGDVPIFPAEDCADVWAHPELFDLDEDGYPRNSAGVGPDYFSPKGQMWGNPLYNWGKSGVKKFWRDRLAAAFSMYDVVRLDHFRGFADYWAIPRRAKDASEGKMLKGPGKPFLEYLRREFPAQKFVAEDLGLLSKRAKKLRDDIKIPAMAVLQFAFGDSPKNPYLPHNVKESCVYYTGTHDNDTAAGWYASADERQKDEFRRYFRVSGESANWDMICAILRSQARTAIFPVQDILGLNSSARFNTPGVAANNWTWRMTEENFNELKGHCAYIKSMLELTDRFNEVPQSGGKAAK